MENLFCLYAKTNSKKYAPKILNFEEYFIKCTCCGVEKPKNEKVTLELLLEGNGKNPDFLLCGHWPFLIVSSKVIEVWKQEKITGFLPEKVKLFEKNSEKMIEIGDDYFKVTIYEKAFLDEDKMKIEKLKKCDVCGEEKYQTPSWSFGKPIIREEVDKLNDIFVLKGFEYTPVCNYKVVKSLYQNKISNYFIKRFDDIFNYLAQEVDVKKLQGG